MSKFDIALETIAIGLGMALFVAIPVLAMYWTLN
jgi:hypothetical protein